MRRPVTCETCGARTYGGVPRADLSGRGLPIAWYCSGRCADALDEHERDADDQAAAYSDRSI